jgi:hypothetical protein
MLVLQSAVQLSGAENRDVRAHQLHGVKIVSIEVFEYVENGADSFLVSIASLQLRGGYASLLGKEKRGGVHLWESEVKSNTLSPIVRSNHLRLDCSLVV